MDSKASLLFVYARTVYARMAIIALKENFSACVKSKKWCGSLPCQKKLLILHRNFAILKPIQLIQPL